MNRDSVWEGFWHSIRHEVGYGNVLTDPNLVNVVNALVAAGVAPDKAQTAVAYAFSKGKDAGARQMKHVANAVSETVVSRVLGSWGHR